VIFALLTILATVTLAFANGGNDVSKGVATLVGSGRASYRRAIAWGTLWTAVGGGAALIISVGLVKAFTSALVGPALLASPAFPLAIAMGAAAWVLLASATGLPVSTTHALTGAIIGAAMTAGGAGTIRWELLLTTIALPLAVSPLVSAGIGYGLYGVAAHLSPACVCVEDGLTLADVDGSGLAAAAACPSFVVSAKGCAPSEGTWRLQPADLGHWAATAALSFARGVNDTPKIVAIGALAFAAAGASLGVAFAASVAAMTAGSYLAGRRVTTALGEDVVQMDKDAGLSGAMVAAGCVLAASFYTLPVSTTHVSTGAIVGAGLRQGRGAVDWRTLGSFGLAWIVTLPVAAVFGGFAAWALAVGS